MSSSSPASAVERYFPSRPKNLSAFQSAVLWLAPMETPPAAPSRRMVCWITGVEHSPRSMTSRPQASRPASTPSRSMTPLARGSRPITTARAGLQERAERGGEIQHVRRRQRAAYHAAQSHMRDAQRPGAFHRHATCLPAPGARTPRERGRCWISWAARRCTSGPGPNPGSGRNSPASGFRSRVCARRCS